eukprot:g2602.t1
MTVYAVFVLLMLSIGASSSSEKLNVDLYAESLCPGCRRLVTTVFASIFEHGLDAYMNFHIFYAGNTKEREGKLVCQHGENECYLNKVLGCAIARKATAKEWFPFIECIETQVLTATSNTTVEFCASKVDLDGMDVVNCARGKEGERIQWEAHNKTQALVPPHRWVPWGVINGVPVYGEIYYLQEKLCNVAPILQRPIVCSESILNINKHVVV